MNTRSQKNYWPHIQHLLDLRSNRIPIHSLLCASTHNRHYIVSSRSIIRHASKSFCHGSFTSVSSRYEGFFCPNKGIARRPLIENTLNLNLMIQSPLDGTAIHSSAIKGWSCIQEHIFQLQLELSKPFQCWMYTFNIYDINVENCNPICDKNGKLPNHFSLISSIIHNQFINWFIFVYETVVRKERITIL